MKQIICFFIGHKWKIINKITYYEVYNSIRQKFWWVKCGINILSKNFDIVDRECVRCGKKDFNIDHFKSLIEYKFLKK